jgi:hypothetical protein|tara:strand:+ start:568 stop:891 length:324 start_codon:yes stop_codon:yes gene_type:complete
VFKTNIVVIHDQTPHISRPSPPFLPSRRHPTRHRSALFFISLFLSSKTNNPHDVVLFFMISHVTFERLLFFFEGENLLHFCLREIKISLLKREREKKEEHREMMGYY